MDKIVLSQPWKRTGQYIFYIVIGDQVATHSSRVRDLGMFGSKMTFRHHIDHSWNRITKNVDYQKNLGYLSLRAMLDHY